MNAPGDLPHRSSCSPTPGTLLNMPHGMPHKVHFSDPYASWVLASYADVSMALRHPQIGMYGTAGSTQSDTTTAQQLAQHESRQAARDAAIATRLSAWRSALEPRAYELAQQMVSGNTGELVSMVAKPWCHTLAALAVGIAGDVIDDCDHHARVLFAAMAHATSGVPSAASLRATEAIGAILAGGADGQESHLQTASRVQTFVAISQSLPGAMASIWHVLLQHSALIVRWHTEPRQRAIMVEELLRLSSPSRALFRVALAPIDIGEVTIAGGQQIVLRIDTANHDASAFERPMEFRTDRTPVPHLALGLGMHHCAGAAIVRMALECVTSALVATIHNHHVSLDDQLPCEWLGGFAIDHPVRLPVAIAR